MTESSNSDFYTLEHVLKKVARLFDSGMLQLLDFELRPYRSNESICTGRALVGGDGLEPPALSV